jgi:hypothetical protein
MQKALRFAKIAGLYLVGITVAGIVIYSHSQVWVANKEKEIVQTQNTQLKDQVTQLQAEIKANAVEKK